MLQNYIGKDKVKHFFVNFVGIYLIYNIALFLNFSIIFSLIVANISMIVVSITKETLDKPTTGFSIPDLIADGLGIAVADTLIIISIIQS